MELEKKLKTIKLFSSELGSWLLFCPHALILTIIQVVTVKLSNFDDLVLRRTTIHGTIQLYIVSAEFLLATFLLVWVLRRYTFKFNVPNPCD